MNPTEHGEVFVLADGLECDQDMGNYERFMDLALTSADYITSGMIYKHVIEKERALGYRGRCVEAIPHIRDEIIRRLEHAAERNGSQISIVEIGGTVGDYQNALFIEAARVLKIKHPGDVLFVMVSYLPVPSKIGEMKTRPTQHAVQVLNSHGVQTDIIIARAETPLDRKRKEKIAIASNVMPEDVISAPDVDTIYTVPLNFERDNLGEIILRKLSLFPRKTRGMSAWRAFVTRALEAQEEISIAIVGKYFDTGDFVLSDAYLSVIEAIKFAAWKLGRKPAIHWLNAKDFEQGGEGLEGLRRFAGIIVPGGFGETGVDGKIEAVRFARENKIPYLGLCYGMQLALVEYARHVVGLDGAHTTEIVPDSPHPVIDIMPEQKKLIAEGHYGGTMRLGAYPALLSRGTIAREAYRTGEISERHRHRYEVNPDYIVRLEAAGVAFSGRSPDGTLMEIAELPRSTHPFFLGTQFHPELQSRPLRPHPLFVEFIRAAIERSK
jgi:CTP synthase